MTRRLKRDRAQSKRSGFTLIEILAVIVVISILVSLLLPAVMGAFKTVRIGSVVTEISQLDTAIGRFKATYGIEPPSSILIYEAGAGAWDATNMALVRQLWPQFDFNTPFDLNQNGVATDIIALSGPECLVFFLGGPNTTNTPGTLPINMGGCIGFSKNPANPFERVSTSRDKSVFEFQGGRFVDTNKNGFPEYVDPLPSQTVPYLYYSSYDGQGYNTSQSFNFLTPPSTEFAFITTPKFNFTGLSTFYTDTSGTAWKQSSYQIISPGYDHKFGSGGVYITTGSDRLPGGSRVLEEDNISNFSNGQMQP